MGAEVLLQDGRQKGSLVFAAWASILLISDLPDILSDILFKEVPEWMFWAKLGFLIGFLGLCVLWTRLRPLRSYAFVMSIFYLGLAGSGLVRTSGWWAGLVGETERSFFLAYLRPYLRDLGVTLLVLLALWAVHRRRGEFFLVKGRLDAPVGPVRWLGIREGESWRTFGWIFGGVAVAAVAVPTFLGLRPSAQELAGIVPWIVPALLFAAINAFNEEVYFRLSLLSTLPRVLGKGHSYAVAWERG